MKETGIVRRVDDLGRVVIPREIRKQFGIKECAPMEIFVDEDKIILKKYDVSIGLSELVRKLDDEFVDIKSNMDTKIVDQIAEHINALKVILKSVDIN